MIKTILLFAAGLSICKTALCQQRLNGDSLKRELIRTTSNVESLRKKADAQDSVKETMEKMIDVLSHSSDSATNGLAGWREAYSLQSARFDSTLVQLDSCLGVSQRQKQLLRTYLYQKNREKFGQN